MARVENNGIIGAMGSMVFYTMNGKNYVRSKPDRRPKKRNQPALEVNTVFGTVSSYGSPMIKALGQQLVYKLKLPDYNRLRGWMRDQYAKNYQAAEWPLVAYTAGTCQVNASADLRDHLFVDISLVMDASGQIILGVPSLNPSKQIKAPSRTRKVVIKAIAISSPFNKKSGKTCTTVIAERVLDYNNDLQPAEALQLKVTEKGILIVAIVLEFIVWSGNHEVVETELKWLPAAIVAIGRV